MRSVVGQSLARLLLSCLGILFALVATEIALRLLPLPDLRLVSVFQLPPDTAWKNTAWDDPPPSVYRRDRQTGWEHTPGISVAVPLAEHAGGSFQFHTNNLGLRRDSDAAVQKTPGQFRVLVLGDSHTD